QVELVIVTNGAECAGGDAPRFPLKALALGPVRVIPRELPFVSCRSLDLPGALGPAATMARSLLGEIEALPADDRVAFRDGHRFVERYERWPLDEPPVPGLLRQQGGVRITG